jgi:hypothetical protein
VRPNFTLTYGVAGTKPYFPDKPTANPRRVDNYNYATDIVPSPAAGRRARASTGISPATARQQVRGGIGCFSGRNPFVYLSNQYGNTGIEFRAVAASATTNNVAFSPIRHTSPSRWRAGTQRDRRRSIPTTSSRRSSAAILPTTAICRSASSATSSALLETVSDVNYSNLNLVQTAPASTDARSSPVRYRPQRRDPAPEHDKGDNWMITTQLERRFRRGWFARGAYSYGRSNSISDTTNSTRAPRGERLHAGDINDVPLCRLELRPEHRWF